MRTFQLFSFVAVCAVASGGYINVGYSGQGAGYSGYNGVSGGYEGYYPVQVDYGHANVGGHSYHSRPKYAFDYAVSDPHTGDHKTQWETRDGDVVKGAYSVAEPDGTTRIVEYTADKIHGFQAVVKRIGHAKHPQQNYNPHGYVGYNGHY